MLCGALFVQVLKLCERAGGTLAGRCWLKPWQLCARQERSDAAGSASRSAGAAHNVRQKNTASRGSISSGTTIRWGLALPRPAWRSSGIWALLAYVSSCLPICEAPTTQRARPQCALVFCVGCAISPDGTPALSAGLPH